MATFKHLNDNREGWLKERISRIGEVVESFMITMSKPNPQAVKNRNSHILDRSVLDGIGRFGLVSNHLVHALAWLVWYRMVPRLSYFASFGLEIVWLVNSADFGTGWTNF